MDNEQLAENEKKILRNEHDAETIAIMKFEDTEAELLRLRSELQEAKERVESSLWYSVE